MKLIFILMLFFFSNIFSQDNTSSQTSGRFEKIVRVNIAIDYLIYLPFDYNEKENWPLVLFLHGSGERGGDLSSVKRHGPPMLVESGKHFPFILISPQCPAGERWKPFKLSALLNEVLEKYKVDKNRIYATGLSMGGEGVWSLTFYEPERFAAIAPVCGRSSSFYLDACRIKNLPAWVFHGAKDDVVFPEESERIVKALKQCGSKVNYTLYPDANHNSWTETYNNDRLYEWLLEHSLEENNQ